MLRSQLSIRDYSSLACQTCLTRVHHSYNIVLESTVLSYISSFYSTPYSANENDWTSDVHPHKLSLIYMILSTGSLYDQSSDPNDFSIAKDFYHLATESLSICNFLDAPTIPALQCLVSRLNLFLLSTFVSPAHASYDCSVSTDPSSCFITQHIMAKSVLLPHTDP